MSAKQSVRTLVLVTGANQGIGFQVAKSIASNFPGHHVLMGCRNPEKGEEAAMILRQQGLSVEALLLDVRNDASLVNAAKYVETTYGRLDVLVNNAGIANDSEAEMDGASLRALYAEAFDTNLFGAAKTTEIFSPLLERSAVPRVVFTSSGLGSLTQRTNQNGRYYSVMLPIYRTSKAALNMLCLHYAVKYKEKGWKVNTVDPGHVATSLNRFRGPDPVEDGATQLVQLATLGADGPTGSYTSKEGPVPW